jgi:dienelactone hydrolase
MHRLLKSLVLLAALAASGARADSLSVVPPLPPGRYDVGCSDVAEDFSRLKPGETADDYWEGIPDASGNPRYVTSLFSSSNPLVVNLHVPLDAELFGAQADRSVTFATIVCYPTEGNPRPDYLLPNGRSVPHMQQNGQPPLFASDQAQFPVLVFSHGLSGSPLSSDYLRAVTLLASYGYVVIAPFHGDERVARIRLDDLGDFAYALGHFREYTAMQAIRPLALSAALDAVLADPAYAARSDATRVGGFGGSLGGESLMLMAGGQLTTTLGLSSRQVMRDARLKAAVGYVPYFGVPLIPAFGRDQKGLDDVAVPYLAIAGTNDTTAPIVTTGQGMLRLTKAARQMVALEGVTHGFDEASKDDIFTWSVIFLDAYVRDDPLQRAKSARMESVSGGGADRLLIDYASPIAPSADERTAVEFYNASLDHYFITAEPDEAAMLDAGVIVPGWRRTGFDFKVHKPDSPNGVRACRFFGTPGRGPNSHFFTIDAAECEKVKANPDWTFEGLAFKADLPTLEDCPVDRIPVIRLYNNGKGGQANHRFLTSHSEILLQLAEGWIREGAVFCGIP